MSETATEAAARAIAPLLKEIADDAGLRTADQLPVGCCVKVLNDWLIFEGLSEEGAMLLSTGSTGFSFLPGMGERFVWASPF